MLIAQMMISIGESGALFRTRSDVSTQREHFSFSFGCP